MERVLEIALIFILSVEFFILPRTSTYYFLLIR